MGLFFRRLRPLVLHGLAATIGTVPRPLIGGGKPAPAMGAGVGLHRAHGPERGGGGSHK